MKSTTGLAISALMMAPGSAFASDNSYRSYADIATGSIQLSLDREQGQFPEPTPTMRLHKIARAIALRDEAYRLQDANGGTLSPEHLRYINKKAARIRATRG